MSSQRSTLRRSVRGGHPGFRGGPGAGGIGSPMRSSIRSKGSSSTGSDPRDKVKDCFRKLISFMFTQVGVGALVVSYALVGAVAFISIETAEEAPTFAVVQQLRKTSIDDLWNITRHVSDVDASRWNESVNHTLFSFQEGLVQQIKLGYDGRNMTEKWSYPAALMFCLSIFTMIGYGNLVPVSDWGKAATIIYAVVGIPIYVLYFMNMGKVLAETFRWLYRKASKCGTKRHGSIEDKETAIDVLEAEADAALPEEDEELVIVPATACLWVMVGYIFTGTIMFAEWERWEYLDSTYFCVTSLCKIGIGDFVPGNNIQESKAGNQSKLVINFIYLLLGMGLVAMCYNLMKEEVRVKMRQARQELRDLFQQIRCPCCSCLRFNDYL